MAQAAAVQHYTNMALEAVARFGPVADVSRRPFFDPDYGTYEANPFDPRTPEPLDEELTEDAAQEAAMAEALATPSMMAGWLGAVCSGEHKPVDVRRVTAYSLLSADAPTLLAVLLAGDDRHALRALRRLRELAAEDGDNVLLVGQRADALLAANRAELGL